jgi:hypothetical protein
VAGELVKINVFCFGQEIADRIKSRVLGLDLEFFHDFISRVFSNRTTVDRRQDTGAELNDFSSCF